MLVLAATPAGVLLCLVLIPAAMLVFAAMLVVLSFIFAGWVAVIIGAGLLFAAPASGVVMLGEGIFILSIEWLLIQAMPLAFGALQRGFSRCLGKMGV